MIGSSGNRTVVLGAAPVETVKRERFHQLDGLRAIAATLVVLHHAGVASVAQSLSELGNRYPAELLKTLTSSGVELFFVLSGVVLLRPYLRSRRPMNSPSYFNRRIQRLWPPFLAAWVLAGIVVFLMARYPTWWTRTAGLPDFTVWGWVSQIGIIYVGKAAYNFAWWSLTIEVLFYLLVPLLVPFFVLRMMTRRGMLMLAIVAAGMSILAFNAPVAVPDRAIPFEKFFWYLPCFAAGILLARYDLPEGWGVGAIVIGAAYCLLAFHFSAMNVHVGWAAIYFGVVTLAMSGGALARRLSPWPLVWLGERSYSLFLVHFAVFSGVCHAVSMLTTHKGMRYVLTTRLIEIPLALLISMLIFHFIERRFARNLVTADHFWPIRGLRARIQTKQIS